MASEPLERLPVAQPAETDRRRFERLLRGDLDNVLLTALRREPERRYGSVTALADDFRRHREGRPVKARPDTLCYRAGKFVRRNRLERRPPLRSSPFPSWEGSSPRPASVPAPRPTPASPPPPRAGPTPSKSS